MIKRYDLVHRYLQLQDEARRLGLKATPHITVHMSDEEIVRLGKDLAQQVAEAKAGNAKAS